MKHLFSLLTLILSLTIIQPSIAQLKNPKHLEYEWTKTDTNLKNVSLSEIQMVLPRHGFPTIDYPKFIGKRDGFLSFYKDEPVISVVIDGLAKAYPLNMLTMHEISNDTLAGIPILPTFCPLCNASMVYDRRVSLNGEEKVLEFEVSGMLRNSDMIMADKESQSWWQQLMGLGIVGAYTDVELTIIASQVITVESFFVRYPNGQILSPETGTEGEENYGKNPYIGYDNIDNKPYDRFYDPDSVDNRLPAMERIIDIKGKENFKVYPLSILAKKGVINDNFEDEPYVLFYQKGMVSVLDQQEISKSRSVGSATVFSRQLDELELHFVSTNGNIQDNETESFWDITGRCTEGELKGEQLTPVIHSNHFAFAFLQFYPEAIIYSLDK